MTQKDKINLTVITQLCNHVNAIQPPSFLGHDRARELQIEIFKEVVRSSIVECKHSNSTIRTFQRMVEAAKSKTIQTKIDSLYISISSYIDTMLRMMDNSLAIFPCVNVNGTWKLFKKGCDWSVVNHPHVQIHPHSMKTSSPVDLINVLFFIINVITRKINEHDIHMTTIAGHINNGSPDSDHYVTIFGYMKIMEIIAKKTSKILLDRIFILLPPLNA